METLRKGLDKVLEFVCCVLLGLMTIFATWQVASRYVFNKPSTVTEELVLICFVWMGLLGAAYVFGKQEHMRMSFLVDKLSEKNQEKMGVYLIDKGADVNISNGVGEGTLAMSIRLGRNMIKEEIIKTLRKGK